MQRKPIPASTYHPHHHTNNNDNNSNHHHHHHHHLQAHHQACAACKHQRKKCTDKCILAPFFPAEKSREFQAVHKVFGVSNVQKIIRSLVEEEDRRRATESLIWEAICRQRDPVLGPYGEYRKVYDELKLYKLTTHHHAHARAQAQALSQARRAQLFGLQGQSIAHHQLYQGAAGGDSGVGAGGGLMAWEVGKMGKSHGVSINEDNEIDDNIGNNNDNGNNTTTNNNHNVNNNNNHSGGFEGQISGGSIMNSTSVSSYGLICSKDHNVDANGQTQGKVVAAGQVLAPNNSVVIRPQDPPGFNQQQFYISAGQLSPLDAKSIESTIWESAGS